MNEKTTSSNEELYYRTVHTPFNYNSGRIPSPWGVASASICMDGIGIYSTDANGNIVFKAGTGLLGVSTGGCYMVNDGTWDPTADDDAVTTLNTIGLTNTTMLTTSNPYRLVGVQFKLTYIGAELYRSGIFFGCHDFNVSHYGTASMASFNQMQDSEHFKIFPADRGITIIYTPYDESYLEYTKQGSTTPDTKLYNITFGLRGGQASTSCILFEQRYIFEYIPPVGQDDTVERKKCLGKPTAITDFNSEMIVRPLY